MTDNEIKIFIKNKILGDLDSVKFYTELNKTSMTFILSEVTGTANEIKALTADIANVKMYFEKLEYTVTFESKNTQSTEHTQDNTISYKEPYTNYNKLTLAWDKPKSEYIHKKTNKNLMAKLDEIPSGYVEWLKNGVTINNINYDYSDVVLNVNQVSGVYINVPNNTPINSIARFYPYIPNDTNYITDNKTYEYIEYNDPSRTKKTVKSIWAVDQRPGSITNGGYIEWLHYEQNSPNNLSVVDYNINTNELFTIDTEHANNDYNLICENRWYEIAHKYPGQSESAVKEKLLEQLNGELFQKYQESNLKYISSELNILGTEKLYNLNTVDLNFKYNELTGLIFEYGYIQNAEKPNFYDPYCKILSTDYDLILTNPMIFEMNYEPNISGSIEFVPKLDIAGNVLTFHNTISGNYYLTSGSVIDTTNNQLLMLVENTQINDIIYKFLRNNDTRVNNAYLSGYIVNKMPNKLSGYISGNVDITETVNDLELKYAMLNFSVSGYTSPVINYLIGKEMITSGIKLVELDEWNDYYAVNFVKG